MMSTLINYFLEASICWFVLLCFYQLFLRKLTFNHLSRFYLLTSIFLGLTIPIMPSFQTQAPEFVYHFQDQLGELAVVVEGYSESSVQPIVQWSDVVTGLYLLIAIYLLFRIVYGIRKIYQIRAERIEKIDDAEIFYHRLKVQPFSFINRIFIPTTYPGEFLDVIKKHELAHVKNGHSIDILCVRFVQAIFWINPMLKIFESYLKETHEHIADQQTLSDSDLSTYRRALQFSAFSMLGIPLAQAFHSTNISKRLKNMKKSRSNVHSKWLYLMILPVVFVLSMAMNTGDKIDLYDMAQQSSTMLDDLGDLMPLTDHQTKSTSELVDTVPPPAPPKPPMPPAPPAPPAKPTSANPPVPPTPPVPPAPAASPTQSPSKDAKQKVKTSVSSVQEPTAVNVSANDSQIIPYKVVEEMPRFPGCDESKLSGYSEKVKCSNKKLIEFISNNLIYPKQAEKAGVDGTVLIQFTVTKKGEIEDAIISRNIGKGCGQAALDVVLMMNKMKQKWIPGKQDGQPVDVQFVLPIKFKLDPSKSKVQSMRQQDEVYKIVEDLPRFPGCENQGLKRAELEACAKQNLFEYLFENIRYPEEAKKAGIEGTSIVQFIVNVDGTLSDVKIVKDVAGNCGLESKRVVQLMNEQDIKWIPGKQDGQPVRVQYSLPIKYKL